MALFRKQLIDQLYLLDTEGNDVGFIAFVIPAGINPDVDTIELKEALASTVYSGSFVFAAVPPVITDAANAKVFVTNIYNVLFRAGASRAFIWLQDNSNINAATAPLMGINSDGTAVSSGLQATLTTSLSLTIANGMLLSWTDDTVLQLNGSLNNNTIGFSGPSAPQSRPPVIGNISFSGPLRGTIQFTIYIQRQSLYDDFQWGFQFLYPMATNDRDVISEWIPLADTTKGATDLIQFKTSIDPTDVFNTAYDPCRIGACTISGSYASRRTWFNFTGTNIDGNTTRLASFFRTVFGAAINLLPQITGVDCLPARLVFAAGEATSSTTQRFLVTPEGDFTIEMNAGGTGTQYLIGGLQGTEFFSITPKSDKEDGDKIRFLSNQPAFAPKFPFDAASPVKTPQVANAPLLDNTFYTSWATFISTPGNSIYYVAQPKGSSLFGNDEVISPQYSDLFGHKTPGFLFVADDSVTFPIVPYNGVISGDGINSFSQDQIETFENQLVSPTRRKYVGQLSTSQSLLAASNRLENEISQTSTTPSGLLVTLTSSGAQMQWNEVLLGQNTDAGKEFFLKFLNPEPPLVEALQTGDLMLVVANADYLGQPNGNTPGQAAFLNTMSIGNWEMTANVGQQNKYNDYRNVMLIKAKKGKLYDPANVIDSLVANPSKWTQKETFASPSNTMDDGTITPPDNDQLVILSQWLQNYFKQANLNGDNKYYSKFNSIARDENWTGILFLRMDISRLPDNLTGIMAGVTEPNAFNAHHLAVEISPVVKNGANAALDNVSTIFGLIYYLDPDFVDDGTDKAIAPVTATTYDFRLLTLKVLFENTSVRSFESLSQLTVNELLKMEVSGMSVPDNVYHNVLLKGSLQITDNQTIYNISSQGDNSFYFDNNIIHKIQISNVVLSTLNTDNDGNMRSWFAMSGFIDYYLIGNEDTVPAFDIFSFGNNPGEDNPNQGLRFNNLGILMTYPGSDPSSKAMVLDASQISFDTSHSKARNNSIFLNFALDLQGLVIAEPLTTLSDKGYLAVIPDIALSDVSTGSWYGLRFKLNMGTPGELAGKISLDSYLLIAWSPHSKEGANYKASIGISLPGTGGGAKLISLQNVMKLSIGQIRLAYNTSQNSFLLMFTEIALKFLGMLKVPPNGSTLFYLFGNPDSGGKASGLGWYAMYKKKTATTTV
ncbi:hypothetical protein [Chitinophaga sancti]|uniref:Uncharacterized protein n=1 Tax=Chitinophaga sancti TaxID=1004 RepID=A0A1K1RWM7_9BACT|nr:hypothetical protein [Chitinophaga sancti]WQD64009.1 hypothetical protein U0033_06345 [Chitinophaga sancti]WQG90367.1 hypothetical protein SR876_02575 [Chitinophaga sancti]SFW76473.1 hypothetical protein SAMN05661012_04362 [Chitinophaga sancti]